VAEPGLGSEPVWDAIPIIIPVSDCNLNLSLTFFEKGTVEQSITGEAIIRP
jgi:hypothetical protein